MNSFPHKVTRCTSESCENISSEADGSAQIQENEDVCVCLMMEGYLLKLHPNPEHKEGFFFIDRCSEVASDQETSNSIY